MPPKTPPTIPCPTCEDLKSEYYTAVPGVLALMERGRIVGKIRRCSTCKRFKDNIAAFTSLVKYVTTTITWIEPEEKAYATLKAKETRKGRAFWPDGMIRAVNVGVPDSYLSIPAHGKIHGINAHGFVFMKGDEWYFTPDEKYAHLCQPK